MTGGGVAPAGAQFPSPFGLRKLKSPPEGRGAHGGTGPPVRADLPRRGGPSAEGPRPLHPPLEACRPARGPGGLPGRSLSLSLGRESEARTSGATGVNSLRENPAGQKRERRTNQRFTKHSSRTKRPSAATAFGHFLLMGKVATPTSDVCLTNSQTTNTSHGTR